MMRLKRAPVAGQTHETAATAPVLVP
jgi:hypothetical protein